MGKNIITVERAANKGMVVEFSGGAQECMEALGNVIATAVTNMAENGTPAEAIRQQIQICMEYGLEQGEKQATRPPDGQDTQTQIGYTVEKERWLDAIEGIQGVGNIMANHLLAQNQDGRGKEDADELMADVTLACTALAYVSEFAADKCRIVPLQIDRGETEG